MKKGSIPPEKWYVKPNNKKEQLIIAKWFDENYRGTCVPNFYLNNAKDDKGYGTIYVKGKAPGNVIFGDNFPGIEDFLYISFNEFLKYFVNKNLKIIGYKAPYDIFGGRVKKGNVFDKKNKMITDTYYHPSSLRIEHCFSLPEEIVETWEPVFEKEFNTGDWVYVVEAISGCKVLNKQTAQVVEDSYLPTTGLVESEKNWDYKLKLRNRVYCFKGELRKATEEEINKTLLPIINDHQCIDNGDRTITCGCTTKSLDWILGMYEGLSNNNLDHTHISKVKVTVSELEQILNYFGLIEN